MGMTRSEIRRSVGLVVGDCTVLVATSDGSESTFIDNKNLVREKDGFAGSDIVFTGGSDQNLGQVRYVLSSERATFSVSFGPEVTDPTMLGHTADLFNSRETGMKVTEWDEAINQAIRHARNIALVKNRVALGTFDEDTGTLAIPSTLDYSGPISYLNSDGVLTYPKRSARYEGDGWRIDDVNRLLVVEGPSVCTLDGCDVYMTGFGPPEELNADADETELHPGWLQAKVRALAYSTMQQKGRPDLRADAAQWEGMARDLERHLRPGMLPPNTVRLW